MVELSGELARDCRSEAGIDGHLHIWRPRSRQCERARCALDETTARLPPRSTADKTALGLAVRPPPAGAMPRQRAATSWS
jgi:hypothetical protein